MRLMDMGLGGLKEIQTMVQQHCLWSLLKQILSHYFDSLSRVPEIYTIRRRGHHTLRSTGIVTSGWQTWEVIFCCCFFRTRLSFSPLIDCTLATQNSWQNMSFSSVDYGKCALF